MTLRTRIAQTLLFIAHVLWAVWFGGQVFNAQTFAAMYFRDLPSSLVDWTRSPWRAHSGQGGFFAAWGAPLVLAVVAAVAANWHLRARRPWLAGAGLCLLLIAGAILFFMAEEIGRLTSATGGLSTADLTARATRWQAANWLRIGVELAGLLCLLQALSLPPHPAASTPPGARPDGPEQRSSSRL